MSFQFYRCGVDRRTIGALRGDLEQKLPKFRTFIVFLQGRLPCSLVQALVPNKQGVPKSGIKYN